MTLCGHYVASFKSYLEIFIFLILFAEWIIKTLDLYSSNLDMPTLTDINWSAVFIYLMGKEAFSIILNAQKQ